MFIPNSRIHLEWPDTYKLLPDALHPALLIFSPFHPFTFVSLPYQQTNRYAVDSEIEVFTSNFGWIIRCLIPSSRLNYARALIFYIHQKRKLLEVICHIE